VQHNKKVAEDYRKKRKMVEDCGRWGKIEEDSEEDTEEDVEEDSGR